MVRKTGKTSTRIGELMVQRGLLSPAQLEKALDLQLIFGGTVGTCMLELGYVSETQLARALAAIHGLKPARPEMFLDIPDEILRKVPAAEVARRRAVPFGIERSTLHVALTDPRGSSGLSAVTGRRIIPYIAPEMLIVDAMERFYGIPKRKRYVKVPYAGLDRAKRKAPAAVPKRRPRRAEVGGSVAGALGEFSKRLSRVESHFELGEVILEFTQQRARRCLLFDVDRRSAAVVNWKGVRFENTREGKVALPVVPASVFGLALDQPFYKGRLPESVDCGEFYGALGLATPREVLVLPIYGEDRLEVVLYADGGPDASVDGTREDFLSLLAEVDLALRMLACKQRLTGVASEVESPAG